MLQQLTGHGPSQTEVSLNLIAVLPAKSSIASQQIQSAFEPGVQLSHCIYREQYEEPASSYIIKSQSSGSRTIVNYNELPEMTVEEFKRIADDLGSKATWFHFEVSQLLRFLVIDYRSFILINRTSRVAYLMSLWPVYDIFDNIFHLYKSVLK